MVTGAVIVWIALMVAGFLLGYKLTDHNKLMAGLVGVLLASGVWVVLVWIFAGVARGRLLRRGYDLTPQRK